MSTAFNRSARFPQFLMGPEKKPLLLIEDALAEPDQIVGYAASDGALQT